MNIQKILINDNKNIKIYSSAKISKKLDKFKILSENNKKFHKKNLKKI